MLAILMALAITILYALVAIWLVCLTIRREEEDEGTD